MDSTSLLPTLLERAATALAARRRIPGATYRLQFHAGFTFRDAAALVDYLRDLGITDAYASPYLKARPGSLHGYDIVDHRQFNPEIGTEEDYRAWTAALHERAMGQLLDVVPNHAGIIGNENVWWNDVLENGPASPYAGFFDIDWHSLKPDLNNKVLLPFLGDPYGKVLESLQLHLTYEGGAFFVHYFDHRFPVAPCTYGQILDFNLEEPEAELGKESGPFVELQSILTAIAHLPPFTETDPARKAERQREKEVIKRRLAALTLASPAVMAFVERNVALINGHDGDAHSFDRLDHLLDSQPYRLSSWRVASDEINYRRFFDVNELAALSMEKEEVFEATHELIVRLLREGHVNGLRIDHPDGLFDPRQYLERLQRRYVLEITRQVAATDPDFQGVDWQELEPQIAEAIGTDGWPLSPLAPWLRGIGSEVGDANNRERGRETPAPVPVPDCSSRPLTGPLPSGVRGAMRWPPLYVVVEKILGPDEPLPEDWPTYGTTGYDFLRALNNLFVEKDNADAFDRLYRAWAGKDVSFPELVYQKKFLTLQVSLSSELQVLATQLDRLSEANRWSRDFTLNSLRRALREIIACFGVYRSYVTGRDVLPRDRLYVERAVVRAKRRNPAISAALFDFVRDVLLPRQHGAAPPEVQADERRFAGKFQQLTAPVMAKGLEDTAFYVYNRLLSLNEVGGDPSQFGSGVHSFHRFQFERRIRFPFALSATATHDTKRGEDVRARLNALSEIPQLWRKASARWRRLNAKHRVRLEDDVAPDRNEEYFLYQTLLGAWPLPGYSADDYETFVERIQAYVQKALHEAKVHTSWVNPNPAYDAAVSTFVERILDGRQSGRFLEDFRAFQAQISHYGLFNSLAQTLLKITLPGVPDTYQGTELWDFSLVDPDNRRPVDYERRRRLLAELKAAVERVGGVSPPWGLSPFARALTDAKEDGRIKLYVVWRALHVRREHPELFTLGEYLPAHATAERDPHVCAFLRRHNGNLALAAVPRLLSHLVGPTDAPLGIATWQDAALLLPGMEPGQRLRNAFTGEALTTVGREGQAALPLAEVFAHFPVALFLPDDGTPVAIR